MFMKEWEFHQSQGGTWHDRIRIVEEFIIWKECISHNWFSSNKNPFGSSTIHPQRNS